MKSNRAIYYIILCLITIIFIGEIQPVHFITDVTRWLFEIEKIGYGLYPYADFTWQYPPFSVYLYGIWASILGSNLLSIKILNGILSFIFFHITYRVVDRELHSKSTGLLLVTLAILFTNFSNHFRLFSIQLYTPAILTALVGTVLSIYSIQRLLYNDIAKLKWILLLASGTAITIGSKPEFGIANIVLSIVFFFFLHKSIRIKVVLMWLGFTCLLSLLMYLPALITSGLGEIIAGITGYGFAGGTFNDMRRIVFHYSDFLIFVCLVATLTLGCLGLYSKKGRIIFLFALLGSLFLLGILIIDYPNYQALDTFKIVKVILDSSRYSPIFLLIFLTVHWILARKNIFYKKERPFYLILGIGVLVLNIRPILLGGHFSFFYVFSILLTFLLVYLLIKSTPYSLEPKNKPLLGVLFVLSILGVSSFLYHFQLETTIKLHTDKGVIRGTTQYIEPLKKVFEYMEEHKTSKDKIMTIPYGGNFEYLFNEKNDIFQTQFIRFSLSDNDRARVLGQVKKVNPKFIISLNWTFNKLLNIETSAKENIELWSYINENYQQAHKIKNRYVIYKKNEP